MKRIYLFGYGKDAKLISKGLPRDQYRVTIIEMDEAKYEESKSDGNADSVLMDITDDEKLKELMIEEGSKIVALLDDSHLNLFLTLSLRSLYPNMPILAIADSLHTARKFKLAGATDVIDLYEVSSFSLQSILKKPVATKLLDAFLGVKNEISFREYTIGKRSRLDSKNINDIVFEDHGVLLIGLIDLELHEKFIFVGEGIEHRLNSGDIIACIGKKDDLDRFERVVREQVA
ncbi:MAG: NAD-binding protein [Campylobacterales bacterium]|nr:NAD-binding protein [Campylobacterales bacterium]